MEFWWCLKRQGLKCSRLEFSGCRVKTPAAPKPIDGGNYRSCEARPAGAFVDVPNGGAGGAFYDLIESRETDLLKNEAVGEFGGA